MKLKLLAAAAAISIAAAAPAQDAGEPQFRPEVFRAHVTFLADDLLEGRGAGTRGYDLAARYVASRFEALGLKPVSDEGWFQEIGFVEYKLAEPETAALTIGGRSFGHGKDAILYAMPAEGRQAAEAPLVFAGFGIDAPEAGFDDYKGLDVRGKIVVVLSGFPKGTPSDVGAHLNSEKRRAAEARGAIGMITVRTKAETGRRPWARLLESANEGSMTWLDPAGTPFVLAPGLKFRALVDTAAAEALFAGGKRSLARVLDEADRAGGRPKGFALKHRASFALQNSLKPLKSANVLGVLPGSDPALAGEYLLLMAHLDGLGIRDREGDDDIHNGAMDNATGIATMIEVARAMASDPNRPKRPILFAAVTAEEHGLLGAQYLAKHPVTGSGRIAGVVNLDMPVLLYDFKDVIAFGAEHSTMGPAVRRAGAQMGVALAADPLPQEGLFTRSDHYRFVQEGVPAVFLMTGFANGGGEQFEGFLARNYHKPTDDLALPIDWNAAARFARINYLIAREIADAPEAPKWYSDSFFGKSLAPGAEKAARPK
jgi:Zn-dependent M28 family amino/carboxypeptidase